MWLASYNVSSRIIGAGAIFFYAPRIDLSNPLGQADASRTSIQTARDMSTDFNSPQTSSREYRRRLTA